MRSSSSSWRKSKNTKLPEPCMTLTIQEASSGSVLQWSLPPKMNRLVTSLIKCGLGTNQKSKQCLWHESFPIFIEEVWRRIERMCTTSDEKDLTNDEIRTAFHISSTRSQSQKVKFKRRRNEWEETQVKWKTVSALAKRVEGDSTCEVHQYRISLLASHHECDR